MNQAATLLCGSARISLLALYSPSEPILWTRYILGRTINQPLRCVNMTLNVKTKRLTLRSPINTMLPRFFHRNAPWDSKVDPRAVAFNSLDMYLAICEATAQNFQLCEPWEAKYPP